MRPPVKLFVPLLAVALSAAAAPPTLFVAERLNGTYTDLGARVKPMGDGLFVVHPTSQRSRVTLTAHSLELTPLGAGEHLARVWFRFDGEAEVAAALTMAGMPVGEMEDEVQVPDQERRVEARIRLVPREADYLIRVLEGPPHLTVAIRSRLAGQIVELCEAVTRFSIGASCEELEVLLANPRIPLPEPGEEYVLEKESLTPEERARIDAYLASAR